MRAASLPSLATPRRSRRLLALAGDERLVEGIARGDEAAFEVAFERYGPAVLAFCRHMLGSTEEAEDAVQHTFAAAYRDLQRGGEREIALKPWLFTIARNRCLSMLRARREQPLESVELPTAGLAEQVEERAELRRLLADVAELPHEQRAALLLAELGDLSHAEVAEVLGGEAARVKALVYRARSALIARREARTTPCAEIREQLANLTGGSLRRTGLQLHLRECAGCRDFREQVRQQRRMLAVSLPVAPGAALKSSVLAAVGLGGGAAGGGGAVAGGIGGALAGLGGAGAAKIAAVGVLAGAGALGGGAVVMQRDGGPSAPAATPAPEIRPASAGPPGTGAARADGVGSRDRIDDRLGQPGRAGAPGQEERSVGPARRQAKRAKARNPQGGPPADVPVRRGPPAKPSPKESVRRGPPAKPNPKEPVRRGPPPKSTPQVIPKPKAKPAPVSPPNPEPAPDVPAPPAPKPKVTPPPAARTPEPPGQLRKPATP